MDTGKVENRRRGGRSPMRWTEYHSVRVWNRTPCCAEPRGVEEPSSSRQLEWGTRPSSRRQRFKKKIWHILSYGSVLRECDVIYIYRIAYKAHFVIRRQYPMMPMNVAHCTMPLALPTLYTVFLVILNFTLSKYSKCSQRPEIQKLSYRITKRWNSSIVPRWIATWIMELQRVQHHCKRK